MQSRIFLNGIRFVSSRARRARKLKSLFVNVNLSKALQQDQTELEPIDVLFEGNESEIPPDASEPEPESESSEMPPETRGSRKRKRTHFQEFVEDHMESEQKKEQTVWSPPNSKYTKVALVGVPNVGKSLLLNKLIDQSVSAVSEKTNTTRAKTVGCLTIAETQVVFLDTPGILPLSIDLKRERTQEDMHEHSWNACSEANTIVFITDPTRRMTRRELMILDQLKVLPNKRLVLCVNKCDLMEEYELDRIASDLNEHVDFEATFLISAYTDLRLEILKSFLILTAEPGLWGYPRGVKTNLTTREQVEEIIREKIFQRVHQEIPYVVNIICEKWTEDEYSINLKYILEAPRATQLKILGGAPLTHIERWAGRDIHLLVNKKCNLSLRVRRSGMSI